MSHLKVEIPCELKYRSSGTRSLRSLYLSGEKDYYQVPCLCLLNDGYFFDSCHLKSDDEAARIKTHPRA